MNITKAKYQIDEMTNKNTSITATINEETWSVPIDSANRHYQAILEWAKIDGNTIEEAD